MKKIVGVLCLVCSTMAWGDSLSDLRKEFEAYKAASEARIQALEKQLEDVKKPAEDAKKTAEETQSLSPDVPETQMAPPPIEERVAALERATLDFEFHGYFRAGLGVDGNGKPMEAFRAPYAGSKYRLGNESEAYAELTYQQNFFSELRKQEGVDFSALVTLAYVTPTSDNNDFDATTAIREAYAIASGVWDAQKSARFWAGNRYYEHLDVHMNDFYFRDMAGFGGGIEDVEIGDGPKVALAWLGGSIDDLNSDGTVVDDDNNYRLNKNTIDMRLYDIETPVGTMDFSLDLVDFRGDSVDIVNNSSVSLDDSFGFSLCGILTSPIGEKIKNRFVLQYGMAAADNFKTVMTAPSGVDWDEVVADGSFDTADTHRFRVFDEMLLNEGAPISFQSLLLYEYYDNGMDDGGLDWISAGIRPIYSFNRYFSVAVEAGADYTNKEGGDEGVLGKFTIAPQITPESEFMSRPAIRAFLTYACWSDGFEGQVSPVSYSDEQDGVTAGVQVEAWW